MSPKRGIKLDQILEFPEQVGMIGLGMLATGGTEFFGNTRYETAWNNVTLGSTAANSNGKLGAWPIPIVEPITVDAMRIQVQTAADTNDDVRLGIYLADGLNDRPSTLLATTTDLAIDTTGAKTGTFTAVLLSPGVYWFAIIGSNIDGATNPIFRGALDVHTPYYTPNAIDSGNAERYSWGKSSVGSTLPDPFPSDASWQSVASPGMVYLQARVA